jgi:fatty acid desaturase
MALTTHPYLAPGLKKKYSFTSVPSFAGYRVNFTLSFIFTDDHDCFHGAFKGTRCVDACVGVLCRKTFCCLWTVVLFICLVQFDHHKILPAVL